MNTTTVVASGTPMSIGDAAVAALLGYIVVFFGLALLMYVIILFGKIMSAQNASSTKTKPAVEAAPVTAPTAPGTAGEVKLYNVSDRDAAMIMAIVANQMEKPLNELRFLSIKEVQ